MKTMFVAVLAAVAASASQVSIAQDTKPVNAKAVEAKVAMCIGCHGIKGYQASFPEIHRVPMISGQTAEYVAASLNAYKKGERKHPTMRSIAMSLSDTDIADISAYYAQHGGSAAAVAEQPAVAPEAAVKTLLDKGACISCHGTNFNKPIAGAPKIAGQHADFLYVSLKAYKTEGNAQVGRGNAIMAGQVKQFSLSELKAMANYIGSLPGDLKTVPQSKFR
jgi:cytochrome c553